MSTHWKYQSNSGECGPLSFMDLVQFVRNGQIDQETRVYSVEQEKWMWASDVFGLFPTARLLDEKAQHAAAESSLKGAVDGEPAIDDEDPILAGVSPDSAVEDETEPSWQRRLREVERQRREEQAERREELREQSIAKYLQKQKEETIAVALERAEQKDSDRQLRERFRGGVASLFSHESLQSSFRWGLAILAANLAAFAILNWSDTEAQRYPDRGGTAAAVARVFPFYGPCPESEYMFLLIHAMAISGGAGYGGARLLEMLTDD